MCTRRVRVLLAPSLRISSSANSSRSNDFITAGSKCWPALVSTKAWGRRSNSCAPINFSSVITCRDNALCEIKSALAAAVKLKCLATPSKARSAFRGSHLRSMCESPISSRYPGFRVADGTLLIGNDGLRRQVQMICGPQSGGRQYQQRQAQRSCVRGVSAGEPVAHQSDHPWRNDQIQYVGNQQRDGNEHVAHMTRGQIVQQPKTGADVEVNGRYEEPEHRFAEDERVRPIRNE